MRWAVLGLIALLAAGIAGAMLFPLSLALDIADAPVEGTPSGTVWRGKIDDAVIQGQPIGTIGLEAPMLATLFGGRSADLTVDGPLGAGRGEARLDGEIVHLSGVDASVEASALGLSGPFGAPLAGTVGLTGDMAFDASGCVGADLAITTDVLAKAMSRVGSEGFLLTGPARCEDGTLVTTLNGRGEEGRARAMIRLRPGTYVSELEVTPSNAASGRALESFGFRRRGGTYTLVTRGTW